jgi:hypothetical protein
VSRAPGADLSAAPRVYLECGRSRVFGAAIDWPGWCRSARDETAALAALTAHRARYAVVVQRAGVPGPPAADGFRVVERVPGTSGTDYGVPGLAPAADREPLTAAEGARLAALVGAAWDVYEAVVAAAPAALNKGPRGGGRDRDAIAEHVTAAEAAYLGKLGLGALRSAERARSGSEPPGWRPAVLDLLRAPDGYDAESTGPRGGRRWPLRYAARRIAWHVLDHAWEIEDRSAG